MFNLLPKDAVFFDLFEKLSELVVGTAGHLLSFSQEFPRVEATLRKIRNNEHAGDELAHEALDRLDRTFITPFDREDIHLLVQGMDSIIDSIDAVSKRFTIYHVKTMNPAFIQQAQVLLDSTQVLSKAVLQLRKSRKLSGLQEYIIEIHRLENVGDENNHAAISHLFENETQAIELIKWKELFDRIEKSIDACEDVSNTLERIVLKNG